MLSVDGFVPILWMHTSNTTTTAKIGLRMCVCVLRMTSNVTTPVTTPAAWIAEWDRTCQAPFCRKTLVGLDVVYETPNFSVNALPRHRLYCSRFCAKTDWEDWYDVCQETGREYVGLASDSLSESEVWRVCERKPHSRTCRTTLRRTTKTTKVHKSI